MGEASMVVIEVAEEEEEADIKAVAEEDIKAEAEEDTMAVAPEEVPDIVAEAQGEAADMMMAEAVAMNR